MKSCDEEQDTLLARNWDSLVINQTTNYDVCDHWVGLAKGDISLEIGLEFSIYLRTNFFTQSSLRIIVIQDYDVTCAVGRGLFATVAKSL